MFYALEVMCCVLFCMLEAVEGVFYVLELREVLLDVLEVYALCDSAC